jgi:hypothetical protein
LSSHHLTPSTTPALTCLSRYRLIPAIQTSRSFLWHAQTYPASPSSTPAVIVVANRSRLAFDHKAIAKAAYHLLLFVTYDDGWLTFAI